MRLLIRSDFDELACAVFLKKAGIIDNYKFVHQRPIKGNILK